MQYTISYTLTYIHYTLNYAYHLFKYVSFPKKNWIILNSFNVDISIPNLFSCKYLYTNYAKVHSAKSLFNLFWEQLNSYFVRINNPFHPSYNDVDLYKTRGFSLCSYTSSSTYCGKKQKDQTFMWFSYYILCITVMRSISFRRCFKQI